MRHSIKEAVQLTGKSRSSLYRDMAKGIVTYTNNSSGRRFIETSELLRAYGEFKGRAESVPSSDTATVSHDTVHDTVHNTVHDTVRDGAVAAVAAAGSSHEPVNAANPTATESVPDAVSAMSKELQALRAEITQLRELVQSQNNQNELLLLELKKDKADAAAASVRPSWWRRLFG